MNRRVVALLLVSMIGTLSACGDPEPMTNAEFIRKQQDQQLAAERESMRIQNDIAREQLRGQQIANGSIQPQYNQSLPQAQPQLVDDGIGMGTVMAGAAIGGAAGYMAGKSNTTTTTYRAPAPRTVVVQQARPAPRTVVNARPAPVVARMAPPARATIVTRKVAKPIARTSTYRPPVKRYTKTR